MSRNNSSSNLRKDSSTPNSLVEFPQIRDANSFPTATTPGIPSRDSSPAITQPSQAGPKNRRVSSAKEVRREASPARSISSTSIARLANSAASQSSPAVTQTSSGTASSQPTENNTEQPQPLSPRPQRPINPNVPHWPTSPRLTLSRSPPPVVRSPSVTSPRRPLDQNLNLPPPSMVARDKESPGKGRMTEELSDGSSYFHQQSTTHRPPRPIASPAPLETVTESSLPSTPAIGMGNKSIDARLIEAEQRRQETSSMSTRPSESSISSRTAPESESDTGNLSDRKPPSRAPSRQISRRPTINNGSRGQDASGDMRAEIETVTSIPQQINPPGTIRLQKKASQETIKPPKEKKKKQKRTAPGPHGKKNKADFFEQRINATLDDAESSDSEETFVYESNPPDKARPRHSRASSVTSLSDPRRQLLDNAQNKTRKMKFETSHRHKRESPFDDYTSDGPGSSTIRASGTQSGLRSHIGRGYTNPNLEESGTNPNVRHANHKGSNQSLRAPHHGPGSRASSRPGSPRHHGKHGGNNGTFSLPTNRREASKLSLYEGDIEGDIDETTPFFQLHHRNGNSKSRPSSMSRRQLEYNYNRQRNWYARIACCIFALVVMMTVVSFALGFVFLTTKPLSEVKVVNITDVIATKQEMMFNMDVYALNPNILPVTISTMDINVFIKSPYVKDKPDKHKPDDGDGGDGGDDDGDGWWKNIINNHMGTTAERRKRALQSQSAAHPLDGIDEGTDPIADPEEETMLLGRIFNFDSPLVFEGSPFRQIPTTTIGEVRLSKPGNKTEVGGSERWERAMLHTFELTIRGFLRYQLPLSGRVRTATVQGTVTVHPNDDTEDGFREHDGSTIEFHGHDDAAKY